MEWAVENTGGPSVLTSERAGHGRTWNGVGEAAACPATVTITGPGGGAVRADLLNRFSQAGTYWDQATYGETTWAFQPTNWVPLPHDRRTYFWQSQDADDARRALLGQTDGPIAAAGTAIIFGTPTGPTADTG